MEVSHGDGGVDWVEVSADVLVGWLVFGQELGVVLENLGVVSDLPRLHFQSIGIGPELSFRIESIEHLPVDRDVLALIIINGNGVQLNVELNEALEVLREEDLDHSLLIVTLVIYNRPLLQHVSLLVDNVGINFTELLWHRILVVWGEEHWALAAFQLEFDFSEVVYLRVPLHVVHV